MVSDKNDVLAAEMTFIFFVYVAPIIRIRGTTKRERSETSQLEIRAITTPEKKVAKHDRKWPNC